MTGTIVDASIKHVLKASVTHLSKRKTSAFLELTFQKRKAFNGNDTLVNYLG